MDTSESASGIVERSEYTQEWYAIHVEIGGLRCISIRTVPTSPHPLERCPRLPTAIHGVRYVSDMRRTRAYLISATPWCRSLTKSIDYFSFLIQPDLIISLVRLLHPHPWWPLQPFGHLYRWLKFCVVYAGWSTSRSRSALPARGSSHPLIASEVLRHVK
jgi:hypothetical protein